MTLLAFIQSCLDAAVESNSKIGTKRTSYAQCLKSLSLFLEKQPPTPLIIAINPKFISEYARYLFSGQYAADYSVRGLPNHRHSIAPRTLEKHLRTLRALVRQAISQGLLPPVDVFPGVFDAIAQEFDQPQLRSAGDSKLPSARGTQREFERLARAIVSDLAQKNRARRAMPALLYVLGLYLHGMELDELLALPAHGHGVELDDRAESVLALLNRGQSPDEFLVRRHAGWQDVETEALAANLAERASDYIRQLGLSLFAGKSVLTDWLRLAKERQLTDADAIAIAMGSTTADPEVAQSVAHSIADDRGALAKRWYVLRSFSQALLSDKLKRIIMRDLDDAGIAYHAKQDFYDPQLLRKSQVRGRIIHRNSAIVSRLLFVRCLATTASRIDRAIDRASLLRDPGARSQFATLPHQAILQLARALEDFRDDIEIVGLDKDADMRHLVKGVRVRILNGPFQGFEGTIEEVKAATANSSSVKVSVEGFPGSVSATLKPSQLKVES